MTAVTTLSKIVIAERFPYPEENIAKSLAWMAIRTHCSFGDFLDSALRDQ